MKTSMDSSIKKFVAVVFNNKYWIEEKLPFPKQNEKLNLHRNDITFRST